MHYFGKILNVLERNADFIIKTLTIIASIGGVISVVFLLMANVENKITDKINDPQFLKKISNDIRIPFLIFNTDGIVSFDGGASDLIDVNNIKIIYDDNDFVLRSIRIKTIKSLNVAPLLSSIGVEEIFQEAVKVDSLTWEYKTYLLEKLYPSDLSGKRVASRFKLEVLR